MLHKWFFKKIGDLPTELLTSAAELLPHLEYVTMTADITNNNAKNYSFGGKLFDAKSTIELLILKQKILETLYVFFNKEGHISTNVSRLGPKTYIKEHSDFNLSNQTAFQLNTVKLQIPIITNDKVALMWAVMPYDTQIGIFEKGSINIIDNIKPHSVVNLSDRDRYWVTSRWKAESIICNDLLA